MNLLLLENRCAEEAAALVAAYGGSALSAPAMQEIPLSKQPELNALVDRIREGRLDVLLCLSVGGAQLLCAALREAKVGPERLRPVEVVVRGPKSLRVLREAKIEPTIVVPEPNTWRELVDALDQSERIGTLEDKDTAVLEAGEVNTALIQALVQRKANVIQVPTYRWALPDELAPLLAGIEALCAGEIHAVLFSNRSQAQHLVRVAREQGKEAPFREAMRRTVTASIGAKTSAALAALHIGVDFEPSEARLETFIRECLQALPGLYAEKQSQGTLRFNERHPARIQDSQAVQDSLFMKACRKEPVPRTPVWLMRQAGRYMAEYRKVRACYSFEDMCRRPEVAAEIALTAVDRIKADAAILFSDILLIAEPLGFQLSYEAGSGPVLQGPQRWEHSVASLPEVEPAESLAYVAEAVRLTRAALRPEIPLLGFSAAPFTLAAYLIEGGSDKNFVRTKTFMYTEEKAWHLLMEKLTRALVKLLRLQADAGANALQVFDSWVGALGVEDYRRYVLPHMRALFAELPQDKPSIHFGTGTASLLPLMREGGGDVIGLDWRTPLEPAWEQLGDVAVQGNLDPVVLFSDLKQIRRSVEAVLNAAGGKPGHIFNLGHGVLPGTPVDHVIALIEMVHEISEKRGL